MFLSDINKAKTKIVSGRVETWNWILPYHFSLDLAKSTVMKTEQMRDEGKKAKWTALSATCRSYAWFKALIILVGIGIECEG